MLPQAVILAGGLGTRLLPLTERIPKPLVLVAGQPFLYWQLRYLKEQGVRDVLLLISHLGHLIEEHFEAHPIAGLNLSYCREHEPLGTGGALKNAIPQLHDFFFLLNGDSFLAADLNAFFQWAQKHSFKASLAALVDSTLVPVPGNVVLENERVARFQKGAGRSQGFTSVDAGVYFLHRTLIEMAGSGRFDLETMWPPLIAQQQLGAFAVQERFFDIGTAERLQQFEEHIDDYF